VWYVPSHPPKKIQHRLSIARRVLKHGERARIFQDDQLGTRYTGRHIVCVYACDRLIMVADALLMAILAIWRRGKPNALLHHSDRGSQYASG
jgi:transposase InsO family protein